MMKIKFNKFERVAGLFVLGSLLMFGFSMISVAVKKGWFETKVHFITTFDNADGLHSGSLVQLSGLRAGGVEDVELTKDNKIFVRFYILKKFHDKVREDSVVQLTRPFIIGERTLDISVGGEDKTILDDHAQIRSHESLDLMSIMSGKSISSSLEKMTEMLSNLKTLAEAFTNKERTQALIKMFDRIEPLFVNFNTMALEMIKLSKQASQNNHLGIVMKELSYTTREMNALIPVMKEQSPRLAKDMTLLVQNLAELTEQFKVFAPALKEIAPEIPQASRRAIEALNEAVVLMKAMQKSMLLRSNAQEVREEEAQAKKPSDQRKPATHESPKSNNGSP